jgi:hypothetical protein
VTPLLASLPTTRKRKKEGNNDPRTNKFKKIMIGDKILVLFIYVVTMILQIIYMKE